LVKEMFRPAELVERIRRLVHGRPPVIITALDCGARNPTPPATSLWPHHPNLRKRPPAPSKGRGPVQVRIRRAFVASGAEVLSSSAIYDWTHAAIRLWLFLPKGPRA
jgi:hypothetical protein